MIRSLPRQCIIQQKALRSCEIDDIQIVFVRLENYHLLNKEDYGCKCQSDNGWGV